MNNNKDWVGNKKTTFSTLGASSHSKHEREENDYYATNPSCALDLLQYEPTIYNVWECSCGEGHLSQIFEQKNLLGKSTDIINRNYGEFGIDFLQMNELWNGWIITNPPYKYAQEFCENAIRLAPFTAMFLKLTFLEGQRRKDFFKKHPPKKVYVYSQRQKCALNGDFDNTGSSAVAYAWYVWERNYQGETIIKWI